MTPELKARRAATRKAYRKPKEPPITPRMGQVVQLMRQGYSSKQIAPALGITVKTVNVYRHRMLKLFEARNQTHLIDILYQKGYFVIDKQQYI